MFYCGVKPISKMLNSDGMLCNFLPDKINEEVSHIYRFYDRGNTDLSRHLYKFYFGGYYPNVIFRSGTGVKIINENLSYWVMMFVKYIKYSQNKRFILPLYRGLF